MKKVVRLTESDLARIVKRVVKEQEEDIPDCKTKLQTTDSAGEMIVGARRLQLPNGEMKIVYSGARPDTRGYIITINETPFCKIPN